MCVAVPKPTPTPCMTLPARCSEPQTELNWDIDTIMFVDQKVQGECYMCTNGSENNHESRDVEFLVRKDMWLVPCPLVSEHKLRCDVREVSSMLKTH
jgi:hypothetical protein